MRKMDFSQNHILCTNLCLRKRRERNEKKNDGSSINDGNDSNGKVDAEVTHRNHANTGTNDRERK